MANEMDVGSIVLKIRADANGVQEGLKQLESYMGKAQADTAKTSSGIDASTKKMTESVNATSAAQTAAYATMSAAAIKTFMAIVSAIDAGVNASERYKAAMIGLKSVAAGNGLSTAEVQREVDKLTDAFFNASAAATSMKNLLSRGYSLDQATQTITRLKDAAAFGRQANLSLADAVQSATEGLRNENSILVDNAGVTKNVAKMWEDYAKSIGVATNSLTQAQKIEAEYQGIMAETRNQVGDLAKSVDTLTGKQAENTQQGLLLSQAYGEEMTPSVKLLTEVQGDLLKSMTDIVKEFPGLTSGATTSAMTLAAFITVTKGWQALKAFNAQLTAMSGGMTLFGVAFKTAFPWIAALSAVIGISVGAWTAHKRAQEAAAQAEEEAAQKRKDHIQSVHDSNDALNTLKVRYEALAGKTSLTYAESDELLGIQKTLKEQYGINSSALDALGSAYQRVVKDIDSKIAAGERELQVERELAGQKATTSMQTARQEAAYAKKRIDAIQTVVKWEESLQSIRDDVAKNGQNANTQLIQKTVDDLKQKISLLRDEYDLYGDLESIMSDAKSAIDAEGPAVVAAAEAIMAEIAGALRLEGMSISKSTENVLTGIFSGLVAADPSKSLDAYIDAFTTAIGNVDIGPAMETMQDINAKIMSGVQPTAADEQALKAGWSTLITFVAQLIADGAVDFDQFGSTLSKLAPLMAPVINQVKSFGEAPAKAMEMWQNANIAAILSEDTGAAAEAIKKSSDEIAAALDMASKAGQDMAENNSIVEGLTILRDSFAGVGETSKETIDATVAKLTEMGVVVPETLSAATISLNNYTAMQNAASQDVKAAVDEILAKYLLYSAALQQLEDEGQGESAQAVRIRGIIAEIDEANNKLTELTGKGLDLKIDADTKPLQQRLDEAVKKAGDLQTALSKKVSMQAQVAELSKIVEAQKKGKASADDWAKAQRIAAEALGYTGDNAAEMGDIASIALAGLSSDAQSLESEAYATATAIQQLMAAAAANPSLNINTSPAQKALQGLINIWNTLAKVLGLKSIGSTSSSRSGGGGGGKSAETAESPFKSAMDNLAHDIAMGRVNLEEEMHRLNSLRGMETSLEEVRQLAERREEVWKALQSEKLSRAYAQLDFQKAIDQLSLSDEIKMLEEIAREHGMSTEERMEWDVKYHEALKRQKDQAYRWEVALLDHSKNMGQLTVSQEIEGLMRIMRTHQITAEERMALEERVFALRQQLADEALRAEEKRISESSNAVKTAYNSIVTALKNRYQQEKNLQTEQIDDQIKALDALTSAENEQKRQSEYAASLADKQRELSVEKSARRRRELLAEIAKMEADEALRLTQAGRQDEKERLQAEKQAIQDRYAEITSEENIRQEALRLVMSRNLQEMTDLISSYGDQWKDAGAQLAEYLTQGIAGAESPVVRIIESLNQRIQDSVNNQLDMIGRSIPSIVPVGGTAVTIQMNGVTIREDADIDALARELQRRIDAEKR